MDELMPGKLSARMLLDLAAASGVPFTARGTDEAVFMAATADSRSVSNQTAFFARRGSSLDGHDFIAQAVAAGANIIVAERETGATAKAPLLIITPQVSELLGLASALTAGQPQKRLRFAAVTGTNGKTSTSLILSQLLEAAGLRTLVIGTTGIFMRQKKIRESKHTTPDPQTFFGILADAAAQGIDWVVMEASSHGFDQARFYPVKFDVGIFTSFSQDHLDYHGTMESYLDAKLKMFSTAYSKPTSRFFVFAGLKDEISAKIIAESQRHCIFYSIRPFDQSNTVGEDGNECRVVADLQRLPGRSPTLKCDDRTFTVPFAADFLLENTLAALLAAKTVIGQWPEPEAVAGLRQIPGRMQCINPGVQGASDQPRVFVDYAHTPDALEKALRSLRGSVRAPGRLIVVFGCGGDRDSGKRPIMGAIAEREADQVWITNDNPRTEDPEKIATQILSGLQRPLAAQVRLDRLLAIQEAVVGAGAEDILLIAGKGHEDYQIIGTETRHFDDAIAAADALALEKRSE